MEESIKISTVKCFTTFLFKFFEVFFFKMKRPYKIFNEYPGGILFQLPEQLLKRIVRRLFQSNSELLELLLKKL